MGLSLVLSLFSYDHEPIKNREDKKGDSLPDLTTRGNGMEVDSRVNAILNNMETLKKVSQNIQ